MPIGTPLTNTPIYWPKGSGTVPWPTGAAAGQFMVAFIAGDSSGTDKREPVGAVGDGWRIWNKTYSTHTWSRVLTADYLAANPSGIAFRGRIVFLILVPGAGAAGARTSSPGATLSKPGAAVMMFGRGVSALLPSAGKLFSDVRNAAYGNRRNNIWFRVEATAGYKSFAKFNGNDSDGFELLPLAGPNPPRLVAPIGGVPIDYAVANLFGVTHQSTQGAPQEKVKVRIRAVADPAVPWSYVQIGGTLTATETSIDTSTPGLTVAANQLAAGAYEWAAATFDSEVWSSWSAPAVFTATTRPVVTWMTMTTGLGNLSPTVSWVATVTGEQIAHRVRIANSAGGSWTNFIWDSGVIAGDDTSLEVPARDDWINGGSYVAWVQVIQTDQLESTPKSGDAKIISWTPPATPTGAVYAAGPPPAITVSGVAAGASSLLVESSEDGGTSWRRVAEVLNPTPTTAVPDPLAPYGVPIMARARVQNTVDGIRMWSAWRTGAAFTSYDPGGYFVDGADWLRVELAADPDMEPIEQRVVMTGAGDLLPSVDRGPRQGFRGSASFLTMTYAQEVALVAWLDERTSWGWRRPPETDGTDRADRPVGTITAASYKVNRAVPHGPYTPRIISVEWVDQ